MVRLFQNASKSELNWSEEKNAIKTQCDFQAVARSFFFNFFSTLWVATAFNEFHINTSARATHNNGEHIAIRMMQSNVVIGMELTTSENIKIRVTAVHSIMQPSVCTNRKTIPDQRMQFGSNLAISLKFR